MNTHTDTTRQVGLSPLSESQTRILARFLQRVQALPRTVARAASSGTFAVF
jgi:hypothetical protein